MEDITAGREVRAKALVFRGGKLDIKMRVEGPAKEILYDNMLFSNVDDATGRLLDTIVRKVRARIICAATALAYAAHDGRARAGAATAAPRSLAHACMRAARTRRVRNS